MERIIVAVIYLSLVALAVILSPVVFAVAGVWGVVVEVGILIIMFGEAGPSIFGGEG